MTHNHDTPRGEPTDVGSQIASTDSDTQSGGNVSAVGPGENPVSNRLTVESGLQNGPEPVDETGRKGLVLDEVFEILKNHRRRLVIQFLNKHGGDSTLSTLAEHIAAIENDTTVQQLSSAQRKRVYVGLYQSHLPKMDEMDVVDFDQDRGTVELSTNATDVLDYLEPAPLRAWHTLTFVVALSGIALFLLSQLGGAQYGLSVSVVLGLVVLELTVLGMYQALTDERRPARKVAVLSND